MWCLVTVLFIFGLKGTQSEHGFCNFFFPFPTPFVWWCDSLVIILGPSQTWVFSPTPAACPTIQLNSDSICLEMASIPKVKGAQSHKMGPRPPFTQQWQAQAVPHASDPRVINCRFLALAPWGQSCLVFKSSSQNWEEYFTYWITGLLLKNRTKEPSCEEMHRARLGEGVELPCSLLRGPSPNTSLCSPSKKLWEPCPCGF